MLPSRHIIASLALGGAMWLVTKTFFAGLLCFLSGTIIDLDHLFDYARHYGLRRLGPKEIYHGCRNLVRREQERGPRRLYILFHTVELAILLWLAFWATKNIYLAAIALGYSGHLIMDMSGNVVQPWAYFISWRISSKFKTARFLKPVP